MRIAVITTSFPVWQTFAYAEVDPDLSLERHVAVAFRGRLASSLSPNPEPSGASPADRAIDLQSLVARRRL
jgi:hypothetical protein